MVAILSKTIGNQKKIVAILLKTIGNPNKMAAMALFFSEFQWFHFRMVDIQAPTVYHLLALKKRCATYFLLKR